MIFLKLPVSAGFVIVEPSSYFTLWCLKASAKLFGIIAITGLAMPGVVMAAATTQGVTDISNLSCQVIDAVSPLDRSIQSTSPPQVTISDSQRKRCIKSVPAIRRLVQSQHAQIVDVRSSERYQEYHLPGSINISEHSVKTKEQLKSRSLLLIGRGHYDHQLFESCLGLLSSGFKDVSVLEGGVQRWHGLLSTAKSESLGGSIPVINSREAFVAIREGEWNIVTDLTPEWVTVLHELLPEQAFIPLSQLLKMGESVNASTKYLFVSEDDRNYQQVADSVQEIGIVSGYWLEGGMHEYSTFKKNRAAQLARLQRGPVKRVGCGVL